MESNKPMAILLGLVLVLSAGLIVTTNTVAEVFTTLELVSPFIRGTSTITVLDPLQRSVVVDGGSGISNDVLHIGEKIVFTGNLMTREGDMLPNIPVSIYALTPTPEQKLVGSAVTGIDGSYSVTWVVEPYDIKPTLQETSKSQGSQTMSIFATFEGNDTFNPSKSGDRNCCGNVPVNVKSWDLIVQMEFDKTLYEQGDTATVFVNFIQGDRFGGQIDYRDFVAPDVIKATYDGKVVELQKKDGTYTFNVDNLSKEHHQLVVSADKEGHNPGTAYLTLIVDGLR